MTSQQWFEIDPEGLKSLNCGREPWDLIKELIQNAWDETPFATECRVTTRGTEGGSATVVTVEDNGSGFADIRHSYTLMSNTPKRSEPTKRGRFNRGEKDVISVAKEATIETTGTTVRFLPDETREQEPNERLRGTLVKLTMPWNEAERVGMVNKLRALRPPPACQTIVDGDIVNANPAEAVRQAQLETVMQERNDGPLKNVKRNARIEITNPHDISGRTRIYEMGIPIQEIDCPWDVDVQIKVPLDEKRDNVKPKYLKKIYAEVLNAVYYMTSEEQFSEAWVKSAIEHPHISREAVRATLKGRYREEKAVFATMDQDACQRARRAGYAVIDKGSLSKQEIKAFQEHCGVVDADVRFPTPPQPQNDYEAEEGTALAEFAEWAREIGKQCSVNATVRFFNEPGNDRTADCQASTLNPTLRFNEGTLEQDFFKGPYGRPEQYRLIIHELGHALTEGPSGGHDELWGEGVAKAGALIAAHGT